ncbi:hypothetical protein GSI_07872 [Ganoderma sinense ZZ0214-1]|uniref:EF-hand domain-containing protein n=1 Tax=Ganoderma sinense ZZ0214-1 TaxID=1077348 RepID=A0A2G8S876_9APHY|nr:hypothetical protein GSI_07872 [Ganoderma sinense ZZ0214-1]
MTSPQSPDTTDTLTATATRQSRSLPPPPIPAVTFTSADPSVSQDDRSLQQRDNDFFETTELLNAADASVQKYTGRRNVSYLNKAGTTLSAIQTDVSKVQSIASPLQVVMDTEPGKAIRQTISAIVEGIPGLLKVLDDVAQVHPFIKIAVGAFRVAVELDLKRRDNDKKISLMFVEMRDMMAVLVQLKDINKDKRAGEDNTTISGRMQNLVEKTEQDIRKCANSCNAYAKKKLLSKVVHSSSWSDEFKGYIQGFTDRRREFELAVSIYIGHAVNAANDKLVTIEEKMDRVLRYLDACMSPEERELTKLVNDHGGPDAVMKDESLLRELFESRLAGAGTGISAPDRRARHGGGAVDEFRELQKELQEDVQTAVRENLEQFEAKFVIQQRELEENLRRAMHREGDRIIDAVISGPHDKILDPDIHEIWKEMRWRGSVKDRHFVLALRDYFREKLEQGKRSKDGATPTVPTSQLNAQDEWTLEYINVTRVQPIIEAFDDDASGFITVTEVNAFTRARPENWRRVSSFLLHWLAYWAVGHQISMSDYAAKIDVLLAKMFALKTHVLPANRNAMEQYLLPVWTIATMLTAAFRRVDVDEQLLQRFEDYTEAEEKRLAENLKTAKYDIDAQDTLDLIRGPGRIEKHVFPLLYLLLKRDFEIMRLARTQCLHVDELYDSMCTILWVFEAVNDRHDDLADLFKHQKLDPVQQFKIFAFEMFKYWHQEEELWSVKKLKEATFLEVPYDDSVEAQGVDPATLINHPLQSTEELFHAHQFVETETDQQADPAIRKILGHWSGFCARGDTYPSQAMVALDLHVSTTDTKEFYCKGIAPNGTDWSLSGQCAVSEDGKTQYNFTISFAARFDTQFFSGQLDESGTALSGSWGFDDSKPFAFIFKRLSSEVMRFYPTPSELAANKPRALWRFAISATIAQACGKMGSWEWLRKRWQTGQRYAELVIRKTISPLTAEETTELSSCQRSMTPEEARLYQIFRDLRERSIPVHWVIYCDVCGDANIRGSRIICVSCGMKTTVDLCSKEECLMSEVRLDVRDDLTSPHLPTHDLLKLRTAIHPLREYGQVYRTAQFALKAVRQRFAHLASSEESESEGEEKPPTCVKCGERTSPPCWYCIECDEDVFVCVSCDTKHGGITTGEHKKTHALVRCQSVDVHVDAESERAAQLNARMSTLETKLKDVQHQMEDSFAGFDARITVTQDRLTGRMASLDERLQRIEDLLLDLGQRVFFVSPSGSDSFSPTIPPLRPVRSQTSPAPFKSEESGAASESDFSAWVREMRTATSPRIP